MNSEVTSGEPDFTRSSPDPWALSLSIFEECSATVDLDLPGAFAGQAGLAVVVFVEL